LTVVCALAIEAMTGSMSAAALVAVSSLRNFMIVSPLLPPVDRWSFF